MIKKYLVIGAIAALSAILPSCQLNVGEEISNPKVGEVTYTRDSNGNPVAEASNTSGSDLEAQFLDGDKDPIGGKISVPAGTTATIPIPPGAEFIQIGEAPTPGATRSASLPSFSFYKVLPSSGEVFLPNSGINIGAILYADIEADPVAGDGWALSRSTFKNLGQPLPVATGTSVITYILVEGDRSYQGGGIFSPLPMRITLADEDQIVGFEVYLDGVLIADPSSPSAILQNGPWGSNVRASTWMQPSLTWLNGAELHVKYRLASDPTPKDVRMNLGTH